MACQYSRGSCFEARQISRRYSHSSFLCQQKVTKGDLPVSTSLKAKLDRIPAGIKMFWGEFNEVRRLRGAKGDEDRGNPYNPKWTRRELELAKRNKQATFLVGFTAMVFCIPAGSLAILGVLLLEPRYLTPHFWSDDMREEFSLLDYMQKARLQQQVLSQRENVDSATYEIWLNVLHTSSSRAFLQKLGLYHGVFNESLYNVMPMLFAGDFALQLTKLHIEGKFDDVIADDSLLLSEGVQDLTRDELQRACLQRMLCSPALPSAEMRSSLESWLRYDKETKMNVFILLSSLTPR